MKKQPFELVDFGYVVCAALKIVTSCYFEAFCTVNSLKLKIPPSKKPFLSKTIKLLWKWVNHKLIKFEMLLLSEDFLRLSLGKTFSSYCSISQQCPMGSNSKGNCSRHSNLNLEANNVNLAIFLKLLPTFFSIFLLWRKMKFYDGTLNWII